MAPPTPSARELDIGSGAGAGSGKGGKGSSTVPGRIGRPPQWTSTRSRKLARLYMYTTLSVDKILKVLEDDVFKPRKNSAQKTIHNMLDHDPRYLRPESREDMNQRLKLLTASSQRSRRSWKKRGDAPQQQVQIPQQQHQHQQQHQPPLPPHLAHTSGYDDVMLHGVKHEMGGHSASLSHLPQQHHLQHPQHSQHPQHAQQQHQHQHQQHQQHQQLQHTHHLQQHPQHPQLSQQYPGQPSPSFLPPPQSLQQQPYHDFYHPQYQHATPAQQHQHPLSMQQMTHSIQPFMGSGWGGVYDSQTQADPASRLTMNSASFDLPQHPTGIASLHTSHQQHASHQHPAHSNPQHQHQHQHQHPQHSQHSHPQHPHPQHPQHQQPQHAQHAQHHYHAGAEHSGLDTHSHFHGADSGITSSHLPLYSDSQRQRRMSSAAYSTDSNASSDVSTETIQNLKNRLSGCSTHYANQVANLLRRFTISSGSDDPSPAPSVVLSGPGSGQNDNSADPHRIRKLWRQRKTRIRTDSVCSSSSGDSFGTHDSDVDVFGESGSGDDSSSAAAAAARRGQSGSPDGRDDKRLGSSGAALGKATAATTILGASGDSIGSARLALPGDFLNAYQYRNDEQCPFHSKTQLIKDEQQGDERSLARIGRGGLKGGMNGMNGIGGIGGGTGTGSTGSRERRCWCAIAETVGAAALEDGSFWVLADGRLTPDAQAMMHESAQQRHQLARRDRFGHSLLHLLAAREGLQMQLLGMVLNCDDATLVATNTAGQTFLHLLAPGWFVGLHEPYAPLLQLLAHLRSRMRQPASGGDADDGNKMSLADGGSIIAHLIYATDVYGRSFFHRFGTFVENPSILASILAQNYDRAALSRRDAFSHVSLALLGSGSADEYPAWRNSPTTNPQQQQQNLPSLRLPPGHSSSNALSAFGDESAGQQQQQQQQPYGFIGGSSVSPSPTATPAFSGGNVPMVFASEDAFIRHHESLLRIVTASDSQPGVEDPEGRNGLHCLAEAIVDKRMMDEHRNALSSGRKPPKKKTLDKREAIPIGGLGGSGTNTSGPSPSSSFMSGLLGGESGSTSSVGATSDVSTAGGGGSGGGAYSSTTSPYMTGSTSLSTTPTSATPSLTSSARTLLHTSVDGAQMATRLRLVQGLLSPPTVVDVNHYDRRGQPVLTAFVVHIPDDQEDKAKSLVAIIETLLAAGARLEGRNRRGETALLVAARLGRKIALTTLLDHGANVHARDAAGRGVLDVLDMQCRRHARRDVALYGRLEACRVLLTSIKQLPLGVKQRPVLLDEWTVVHRRGPEPRDMAMAM